MPKLKKFRVHFISVLKTEDPANGKSAIYKSSDGGDFRFEFRLRHLRKDAKEGLVFGTVYEPDVMDSQRDWAEKPDIADAAHTFLAEKRVNMVDVDHSYEPGSGTIVESFIKNGPDDRFPDTKDGSWVVVIKLSDEAKSNIGAIKGLSMAGAGVYDQSAMAPKSRTRKDATIPDLSSAPEQDVPAAQLIQELQAAGQWPANYDDAADNDGDADDGVTMTDIFNAIQANCDAKGITVGPNGAGVLDALAAKLLDAPPDDNTGAPIIESSQKSATRFRPLKGDREGTRFRLNN